MTRETLVAKGPREAAPKEEGWIHYFLGKAAWTAEMSTYLGVDPKYGAMIRTAQAAEGFMMGEETGGQAFTKAAEAGGRYVMIDQLKGFLEKSGIPASGQIATALTDILIGMIDKGIDGPMHASNMDSAKTQVASSGIPSLGNLFLPSGVAAMTPAGLAQKALRLG